VFLGFITLEKCKISFRHCIWILERIPFINPLFAFSIHRHKQAFTKFIVLWIMCTLPVIMAAALTQTPEGVEPGWEGFLGILSISFSASEQFVYAAAFLPPLIYLYISKNAQLI